ncbi:MAG: flagellin lysine-N-methylase [Oscillospiraceae bacterium]|nr:flagellin lysine-N-methylase [Oscillospiraceae bacterium]
MNTVKASFVKQPKFYKDFKCIGGACKVSCCHRWRIDYTVKEVERLKNADCSDSLKSLIETSFEPIPDMKKYQIKLSEERKCPFHNAEGLCSIQKELGEEYLSYTCQIYPRYILYYNRYVLKSCSLSCPQVLKMICSDDSSMELENLKIKKTLTDVKADSIISKTNTPALKYKDVLFDFFYEILSDRSRSLETSVVLGAMAAQKLDEYIKKGQHDRIPEIIKALKPLLNNPQQIEKLEAVKPNLSLKANFSAGLLRKIRGSTIFNSVFDNGIPSQEIFDKGMDIFREHFSGTPEFMRNIALNLYITNEMPYKSNSHSLFENYCYFAAELAVIKCLIPAVAVRYTPVNEQIEMAISYVDRSFTHGNNSVSRIVEHMKECKLTSPAYLLGIIK